MCCAALCCVLLVFVMCFVCPILPVCLNCVPNFVSVSELCAQFCQCVWIVCPILPVSLNCVPNFASVSELCAQYCQCLWIVNSWLPFYFSLMFFFYILCMKLNIRAFFITMLLAQFLYEGWHFAHILTILTWPHHFTGREHFGPWN